MTINSPLAHALWCEQDGDRDRWHWQTIAILDDDREDVLDAGIEDTKEEAELCIATSLRNHGGYQS